MFVDLISEKDRMECIVHLKLSGKGPYINYL